MARWSEIAAEQPEFAERARARFDAGTHKTIATLRADGSPRISGIEANFVTGDLWLGSMLDARKGADLIRDPRFALHSASADPPEWEGDPKLSGRADEIAVGPSSRPTWQRAPATTRPSRPGAFTSFAPRSPSWC